jgi:glutamate racemase
MIAMESLSILPPDPGAAPIGIFDSGIGGLSVLRHIQALLPAHPICYLADQAHVPYGSRPLQEVRAFSFEITRFLLSKGARVIVVACNTASAAALHSLREHFSGVPFVGMEPAVKPAASLTHSGVVGVLATPATFQGELFASVVERFAQGVTILKATCPGLVEEIENGRAEGRKARRILKEAIQPMLEQQVDTIVLGCTHYPFALETIRQIAGPGVEVIDPSPAVARQTVRILDQQGLVDKGDGPAEIHMYTSASRQQLTQAVSRILSQSWPVHKVSWAEMTLQETAGVE